MNASTPDTDETVPTPDDEMSGVVYRNIQALLEVRRQFERRKTVQERIADRVTTFAGSIWSVYFHVLLYGGWLVINAGLTPIQPFDPFPFVMLAMIALVEAIFLSTFILISQNRVQRLVDKRSDLNMQIGLLTEHELTRLFHLVEGISNHFGIHAPSKEIEDIKKDVRPERVVEEIERAEEASDESPA